MTKNILVVDDSNTFRQQITFTLKRAGYIPIEAHDGQDGLEKLKMTPEIALIISDVNMPGMNGIEFLKAIKSHQTFKEINVLMLTTETEPKMIMEARTAGAKGFMVKPFDPAKLIDAVKKLI